jgi:hypothetical protein
MHSRVAFRQRMWKLELHSSWGADHFFQSRRCITELLSETMRSGKKGCTIARTCRFANTNMRKRTQAAIWQSTADDSVQQSCFHWSMMYKIRQRYACWNRCITFCICNAMGSIHGKVALGSKTRSFQLLNIRIQRERERSHAKFTEETVHLDGSRHAQTEAKHQTSRNMISSRRPAGVETDWPSCLGFRSNPYRPSSTHRPQISIVFSYRTSLTRCFLEYQLMNVMEADKGGHSNYQEN